MAEPTESAAEQQIQNLRSELEDHNYQYYVQAAPSISDREYDEKLEELSRLEASFPQFQSSNSPTQRVGGAPLEGFRTVAHAQPMISLANSYDLDELRAFGQRGAGVRAGVSL